MMTRFTASILAIGASALIAGAVPLPASAQTTPAAPSTAHSQGVSPGQRAEQRLAQMHRDIGITPAQEGVWDQFAKASVDNANKLDAAFRDRAAQVGSMNAVQSMDSFVKIDLQRAQDMQAMEQQFQQLYAALSPEQQQKVDAVFRDNAQRAATHRTTKR